MDFRPELGSEAIQLQSSPCNLLAVYKSTEWCSTQRECIYGSHKCKQMMNAGYRAAVSLVPTLKRGFIKKLGDKASSFFVPKLRAAKRFTAFNSSVSTPASINVYFPFFPLLQPDRKKLTKDPFFFPILAIFEYSAYVYCSTGRV